MSQATRNNKRLVWVRWSVVALFSLAAFSQARVQIFDRSDTLKRARLTQRFITTRKEAARRGAIFSADAKPLVARDTISSTQSAVVLENLISQFLFNKAADGTASQGNKDKK